MKAFTQLKGLACPIDRANIDTDAIIPKQFLKSLNALALAHICLMSGATLTTANQAWIVQSSTKQRFCAEPSTLQRRANYVGARELWLWLKP
jgi:3-isopropylmalate dehydratase small subunit